MNRLKTALLVFALAIAASPVSAAIRHPSPTNPDRRPDLYASALSTVECNGRRCQRLTHKRYTGGTTAPVTFTPARWNRRSR